MQQELVRQIETERDLWNELYKAAERIGTQTNLVMKWLLRFAQCDVRALSIGDSSNLSFELACFAMIGAPGIKLPFPHQIDLKDEWSNKVTPTLTLPRREEALRLQDMIKGHINKLLSTGHTEFTTPALTRSIGKYAGSDRGYSFYSLSAKDAHHAFEYHFGSLLASHAQRIRRCDACGQIYLGVRKAQQFCSTRCQNRVATQRFRKRLKEKRAKSKRGQRQRTRKTARKEKR